MTSIVLVCAICCGRRWWWRWWLAFAAGLGAISCHEIDVGTCAVALFFPACALVALIRAAAAATSRRQIVSEMAWACKRTKSQKSGSGFLVFSVQKNKRNECACGEERGSVHKGRDECGMACDFSCSCAANVMSACVVRM